MAGSRMLAPCPLRCAGESENLPISANSRSMVRSAPGWREEDIIQVQEVVAGSHFSTGF